MTNIAKITVADLVTAESGEPMTTSLKVAEVFGKRHSDVLKAVANLECSMSFNQRNFAPVEYMDAKGEKRPAYQITKDGFVFLAMGFTGPKAAAFKEAYIDAFNRMAETITSITGQLALQQSERAQRALIDTVRSQEGELIAVKEENRRLRNVADKAVPVSEYGSLSPSNGLPRHIFRRPTFAAPPEPRSITITQPLLDFLQLQFDLQKGA